MQMALDGLAGLHQSRRYWSIVNRRRIFHVSSVGNRQNSRLSASTPTMATELLLADGPSVELVVVEPVHHYNQ